MARPIDIEDGSFGWTGGGSAPLPGSPLPPGRGSAPMPDGESGPTGGPTGPTGGNSDPTEPTSPKGPRVPRDPEDAPQDGSPVNTGQSSSVPYRPTTVFAPNGQQGMFGGERGVVDLSLIPPGGRVSGADLRIQRWLGLITGQIRTDVPLGALQDMKNLVLNKKIGAMTLRKGYATYATPTTDVSGSVTLATKYYQWTHGTEIPSTQTIKVVGGVDGSANKHILQSPFFPNSSTVNTGAVKWGETLSITIATGTGGGTTVTFTGGVNVADYYKGWILQYQSSHFCTVTASSYGTGTTTLTLLEKLISGFNPVATPDGVLYRHFHDNPTFAPTFSYTGGNFAISLQQGQSVLFSGGQGSTDGYKPILSTYISKTFFYGATKTLPYAGTYITEAEIKSTNGVSPQGLSEATGTGLTSGYRYFMGYVFETDDGQLSQMYSAATPYVTITADAKKVQEVMRLSARINKRFRYMHVFVAQDTSASATTMPYEQYYFIRTIDLCSTGWTFTDSATDDAYWSKTETVDVADWNSRGSDLTTFLGHPQAGTTTCSFNKAVFVNNRLFVARTYDYGSALSGDDEVRYSVFSEAGVPQFNVLCDIVDATQSTIEPGDPAKIQGIARWEGKLFIVKDNSCHYIQVDADPTYWVLNTITRSVGSDLEGSIVTTPFGIMFARQGDDIYLWDGGYPKPMTRLWRGTYQGITADRAWYDKYTRSYNIIDASIDGIRWYSMAFDVSLGGGQYAWVKHQSSANIYRPTHISYNPAGEMIFVSIEQGGVYKFDNSSTTDAGTGIGPYFKTAPIIVDEKNVTRFTQWHLALESISGSSGTLDIKATTSGAANSAAQTWSSVTKTNTFHRRMFSFLTGRGKRLEFEFNANGTLATFTGLQVNEFGAEYDIVPLRGDAVKTA